MSRLRRIVPMTLPETERASVRGPRPVLKWVKPTDLLVDGTYQRDLTSTSVRLIRRIVAEFAWSRIKPPIAVAVNNGFHVIDGQHTAIAAASLGLQALPIFVVDAPETLERSRAFVSHNRNRIAISALDIHRALVAGGDPLARSIDATCAAIGVRMRYIAYGEPVSVGDTQAIDRVQKLFKRFGVAHARSVLTVLVGAKCCPIHEAEITAAHEILTAGASPARLTMAVRVGLGNDLPKARADAMLKNMRAWQCLKVAWQKRMGGASA